MHSIKETVESLMEALHQRHAAMGKNDPEALLKKVLPARELEHLKVNYFKNGTLHIHVDSSTWLYYFGTRKESLLAQLNAEAPGVKKIVFRLGEVKKEQL